MSKNLFQMLCFADTGRWKKSVIFDGGREKRRVDLTMNNLSLSQPAADSSLVRGSQGCSSFPVQLPLERGAKGARGNNSAPRVLTGCRGTA